jgi:hypothetical protein
VPTPAPPKSWTRFEDKMNRHPFLLADHRVISPYSANASSHCPRLPSTQSTSGCLIKTPPSLYHRRTASNASHRCYKNYSFALIRKLFFARANQSHQELIWPIFYYPTCAITPFLTKLKLPSKSNLVAPISPPTPGTGRRHEGV